MSGLLDAKQRQLLRLLHSERADGRMAIPSAPDHVEDWLRRAIDSCCKAKYLVWIDSAPASTEIPEPHEIYLLTPAGAAAVEADMARVKDRCAKAIIKAFEALTGIYGEGGDSEDMMRALGNVVTTIVLLVAGDKQPAAPILAAMVQQVTADLPRYPHEPPEWLR